MLWTESPYRFKSRGPKDEKLCEMLTWLIQQDGVIKKDSRYIYGPEMLMAMIIKKAKRILRA